MSGRYSMSGCCRLSWLLFQRDIHGSESAQFYLYTLKALAFIKLRLGQEAEVRLILGTIAELDPEDRCGASVIMSLAEALVEEAA